MNTKIIELLCYTIPSLVTGGLAYYFFMAYFKDQQKQRKYALQKDAQHDLLPIRLQAYERMTLFLERISLTKILLRVSPFNDSKNDYETNLINNIEQEFEHNLSQQIYISDECWSVIMAAKNATIHLIRKITALETVKTSDEMRELILNDLMNKQSPTAVALSYIKSEVKDFF